MDEFLCPWCGLDLMELLNAIKPASFDAVYEAHAEECDAFQAELNMNKSSNYMEPLCSGDGE